MKIENVLVGMRVKVTVAPSPWFDWEGTVVQVIADPDEVLVAFDNDDEFWFEPWEIKRA
jgi:hypothetical protein